VADADVIVVGAGLAGLVAACELVERGRSVVVVDQENANNVGGQAFWSFGGLFFVDSPEQRRLGIRDSHELALQDWLGTAGSTGQRTIGRGSGARLRRLCRGGKAQLASRTRAADLPRRRLGRAGRLRRTRSRQLSAALPHHLGDRASDRRRLREQAAW